MPAKRRLQIQLDEPTYRALRRRAYEQQCSLSATVREALVESLRPGPPGEQNYEARLGGIVGIGAGAPAAGRPPRGPISEHHDEAFVEAIMARWERRGDDAD